MNPNKPSQPLVHSRLEMDLELAARACMAQLPSLAARRLRAHRCDVSGLQSAAEHSPSAQRLARKLFSLMANASVHCGGAGTLRPLFDQLALVRAYLWLGRHVAVTAPEPLMRGAPDLIVGIHGESFWVDTRARSPEVMAERGRQAALLVDRTVSKRRAPPLRLGTGYAGEFHLLDARVPGAASQGNYVLEQQPIEAHAPRPRWVQALCTATGAREHRVAVAEAGLEQSA